MSDEWKYISLNPDLRQHAQGLNTSHPYGSKFIGDPYSTIRHEMVGSLEGIFGSGGIDGSLSIALRHGIPPIPNLEEIPNPLAKIRGISFTR